METNQQRAQRPTSSYPVDVFVKLVKLVKAVVSQVLEGLQGLPRRCCCHPQLLVQPFGTAESGGELQEVPSRSLGLYTTLYMFTLFILSYFSDFENVKHFRSHVKHD